MQENLLSDKSQLLTLEQFSEKNPWPTRSSLYTLYKNRVKNGLKDAFSKWGRRIIVDEELLFSLIKELSHEKKLR